MTDEERKYHTREVYGLKMWASCSIMLKESGFLDIYDRENYKVEFIRVPGGWLATYRNSTCFVPMNKTEQVQEPKTVTPRI